MILIRPVVPQNCYVSNGLPTPISCPQDGVTNRLKVYVQERVAAVESPWDSDYTDLVVEPALRLLAVYSPVVKRRWFDVGTGHPPDTYPKSRSNGNGNGT